MDIINGAFNAQSYCDAIGLKMMHINNQMDLEILEYENGLRTQLAASGSDSDAEETALDIKSLDKSFLVKWGSEVYHSPVSDAFIPTQILKKTTGIPETDKTKHNYRYQRFTGGLLNYIYFGDKFTRLTYQEFTWLKGEG